MQRTGRERVRESGGRGFPSGGGLCWTKVGTRRVPEDTRPREEAWSPLLGAGAFFVPRYGLGNVIQWGWSKGKTSKIMIKGGARGVIWLVEISPAFGVTTRGRRGGCPLSLLSLCLLSLSRVLTRGRSPLYLCPRFLSRLPPSFLFTAPSPPPRCAPRCLSCLRSVSSLYPPLPPSSRM